MEFLASAILAVLFLAVVPALAIIAFMRVRKLEQQSTLGVSDTIVTRLATIERRITELEMELRNAVNSRTTQPTVQPQSSPSFTVTPSATQPSLPEPSLSLASQAERGNTSQPAAQTGLDFEKVIAGQWLNRIGIIALLLATAFFLKYAFDNNWVGPNGKVAAGLLVGTGLLLYSQGLLRRGYRYFSEGIAGLGAGILYLSIFAAWSFYQLVPQSVAFASMMILTSLLIVIALGRDSQRMALLALVGGLLTPILLSTGRDAQVILFSYLAVLNAGLLAVGRAREWQSLAPVALLGTVIYYAGWYQQFYTDEKLVRTVLFATLFYAQFAALPVVQSRRESTLQRDQVQLVLLNTTWFLLALHTMLYREYRWALTIAVLVLAASHLAMLRVLPAIRADEPPVARLLFGGLALTFATLAIPIQLEGKWLTMAWAVEGAVLVWSGFRLKARYLRVAGLFLLTLVGLRLLIFPIDAERFLLNPRFTAFAITVMCYATSYFCARQHEIDQSESEHLAFSVVGVATNVFAVWVLSQEVWDAVGQMQSTAGRDRELAQQLSLSLLWIVYATALIVLGVREDSYALRWQALSLFALVVGKVFLFDLSFLDRAYRILSFLVLGLMLLAVSFLYQRRETAGRLEKEA